MRRITIVLMVIVIPLLTGCRLSDARALAGFSEPKVRWVNGLLWSELEISSEFTGNAQAEYNPETGRFLVDVELSSSVVPVIDAQGERAKALVELRQIEAQYLLEAQRVVGDNFVKFGNMLSIAAQGGGEAVGQVIQSAGGAFAAAVPLGSLVPPLLGQPPVITPTPQGPPVSTGETPPAPDSEGG